LRRDSVQTRVSEAFDELASELAAGRSETLTRYLEFLARFHDYSFGNCILISLQRKDARHVAGYRRWLELGRYVRKGERGIAILAPLVRKVLLESDVEGEGAHELRRLSGFRVVHVFDVSQTEGEPLPEFSRAMGEAERLLPVLEQVISATGLALVRERLPFGANGATDGQSIAIRPGMSPAETSRCLVHELAHCQLEHCSRRSETTQTVRETEAEAVACVVCHAFGIDAIYRSRDYIHLWDGTRETLILSLDAIQRTASGIISRLDQQSGPLATAA
jgi:antirestriction protein ArdC